MAVCWDMSVLDVVSGVIGHIFIRLPFSAEEAQNLVIR